jgi:malic enzyme
MAGELGIEPKIPESKSDVLPLHYSPVVAGVKTI